MPDPPRIGYEHRANPTGLRAQAWELRGRSSTAAAGLVARRTMSGLYQCLRMQVAEERVTLAGEEYRYYAPLEVFRGGPRTAPLLRRVAGLLWVGLAERCVELPIARGFLNARPWTSMVEVGNVLGYWYDLPRHVVIDKYEYGPGIVSEDIVDYTSSTKFDVVVSISTLEHVGFDESPPDPSKFLRALRALEQLRKPDGRAIVTVPLGYNPEVDRAVRAGAFRGYTVRALVGDRSRRHGYREIPVAEALSHGEALLVATIG